MEFDCKMQLIFLFHSVFLLLHIQLSAQSTGNRYHEDPFASRSNVNSRESYSNGNLRPTTEMPPDFRNIMTEIEINFDEQKQNLTDILNALLLPYENRLKNIRNRAQVTSRPKIQKPSCNPFINGIDFLLEKLQHEIEGIRADQIMDRNSTSSSNLDKIQNLNSRLTALDVEVSTQMANNCSAPLVTKLDRMTKELQLLHETEVDDIKYIIVESIVSGRSADENTQMGNTTLSDIINKYLDEKFPDSFQNILDFLKTSDLEEFNSGMRLLIEAMKSRDLINTNQFLRLAYEAKISFESELKMEFPESHQKLIWGRAHCIRNRMTNQFLMTDEFEFPENEAQANFNSTPTDHGVHTIKISQNYRAGIPNSFSCDWEFYPLLTENALLFVIRQNVSGIGEWQLNADRTGNVRMSPTNGTSDYTWEVSLQNDGQFSFSESLQDNSAQCSIECQYVETFLCSTKERSNRRNVVFALMDNYCKWFVENPFETNDQRKK